MNDLYSLVLKWVKTRNYLNSRPLRSVALYNVRIFFNTRLNLKRVNGLIRVV